jgi:hypothetical protein
MPNHSFSSVRRRDVIRTLALGGLCGIGGCSDSGGVQTVTTAPNKTGTRARMEKYKDTAEQAAKKNKRGR